MPGASGFDVAERIRCLSESVPLLLVTGRADDVLVTPHAHRAGFNEVLVKPVGPDDLLRKVRELTGEGEVANGER